MFHWTVYLQVCLRDKAAQRRHPANAKFEGRLTVGVNVGGGLEAVFRREASCGEKNGLDHLTMKEKMQLHDSRAQKVDRYSDLN